jgi:hypothetical protein
MSPKGRKAFIKVKYKYACGSYIFGGLMPCYGCFAYFADA